MNTSLHLDERQLAALRDGARDPELLDHVSVCDACRDAWLDDESSRVFGLLAETPIPEEALDRLSASVNDAIAPRRRGVVWGVAASVLLAGALGILTLRGPQPAVDAFETVSTPGDNARVVDMTIGDVQVVMIFDEDLDL